jgi:hypothetical protein
LHLAPGVLSDGPRCVPVLVRVCLPPQDQEVT